MIALALFIVAAILAVVVLIQSRGTAIVAWAVLALAAGLLWGKL
jgi:hypothetical protein